MQGVVGSLYLAMTFSKRIFHSTSKIINTSSTETEFLLRKRFAFFFPLILGLSYMVISYSKAKFGESLDRVSHCNRGLLPGDT